MNEWVPFTNAITANDAAAVIAIAKPEFVAAYPYCLDQFCGIRVDFNEDEAVLKHLIANGAKTRRREMIEYSMRAWRPRLTKALIKIGYGVNERNSENLTPLDVLCGLMVGFGCYNALMIVLVDAGGKLYAKTNSIQHCIDFRENARIASITCIGIGRKRREGRDVFAIIARIVWSERIKRFI